MIVTWLVFNVVFAALMGIAAWALERVCRQYGWPTRPVWAVAIAVATLGPLVHSAGGGAGPGTRLAGRALADLPATSAVIAWATDRLAVADSWVLTVWVGVTAALTAVFVASLVSIMRRARCWVRREVGGCAVLVSDDTGPAVAGFFRGVIVLPRWAMRVDERLRGLMLAHEQEHVAAGDPRLLLLASIALLYMPLNPVLWWLVRRLRLAVEVDCDARVLGRRRGELSAYGRLLLEVGARASGRRVPMPAFSSPAATLEERIRAMTTGQRPHRWRTAGFLLVAAVVTAGAALVPDPAELVCVARSPGWHLQDAGPPVAPPPATQCTKDRGLGT